jgi:hypothetical protein
MKMPNLDHFGCIWTGLAVLLVILCPPGCGDGAYVDMGVEDGAWMSVPLGSTFKSSAVKVTLFDDFSKNGKMQSKCVATSEHQNLVISGVPRTSDLAIQMEFFYPASTCTGNSIAMGLRGGLDTTNSNEIWTYIHIVEMDDGECELFPRVGENPVLPPENMSGRPLTAADSCCISAEGVVYWKNGNDPQAPPIGGFDAQRGIFLTSDRLAAQQSVKCTWNSYSKVNLPGRLDGFFLDLGKPEKGYGASLCWGNQR